MSVRDEDKDWIHTKYNNTSCSIAALFVLGTTELNHVLGSRMGDIDFT